MNPTPNRVFTIPQKAPSWVSPEDLSYFSYFENQHNETWIAGINSTRTHLHITGSDLEWDTISFNKEQVIAELQRLPLAEIPITSDLSNHPLALLILSESERYWIISVLLCADFKLPN